MEWGSTAQDHAEKRGLFSAVFKPSIALFLVYIGPYAKDLTDEVLS
jgi:hypothetical protein